MWFEWVLGQAKTKHLSTLHFVCAFKTLFSVMNVSLLYTEGTEPPPLQSALQICFSLLICYTECVFASRLGPSA